MIRYILILILTAGLAHSVQAGPWLREKGSTFTANSVTGTYYLDTTSQTFIEYGLSAKTTLIADIGMVRPRFGPYAGYATLSMRRALSSPEARSKWAYEFGVGVGWVGAETLPHLRTALSWGRGITLGEKTGWMTAEAAVVWDLTYALHVTKLDATVGLNFTEKTSGMLQVYAANLADTSIATIAPSLVFSPIYTKFRVQLGTETVLGQVANSALKISLWREF